MVHRTWVWLPLVIGVGWASWILWVKPSAARQSESARVSPSLPGRVAASGDAATLHQDAGAVGTRPIEHIRLGDRVLARNPELSPSAPRAPEPLQQTWQQVDLAIEKSDGSELHISLLRPRPWFRSHDVAVGGRIPLEIAEMQAYGLATVMSIQPCPPIQSGAGCVVTGTYRHTSARILDVFLTGEETPLAATADHPFWSEERRVFVPAASLRPGEPLRSWTGRSVRVESLRLRSVSEPVYNLEVHGENVYFVGLAGVLVHNYPASQSAMDALEEVDIGPVMKRRTAENLASIAPGLSRYKVTQYDEFELLCHAHACGLSNNLPFQEKRFGGQLSVLHEIYSGQGYSQRPYSSGAIRSDRQQIVVYGEQFGNQVMISHSAKVRPDALLESKLGPAGHYVIVHRTAEELAGPGYGQPLFIYEKE